MRIGIDVGGTHTDAVLVSDNQVVASCKASTSANVSDGVVEALDKLLSKSQVSETEIHAVMLGTTQFTNAVVERRQLSQVAAIRVALPSGSELGPKTGWPEDISSELGSHVYQLHGGYLYDGAVLSKIDDREVEAVAQDIKGKGIKFAAISSAFSPMNPYPEQYVAKKLKAVIPDLKVTLSNEIGRLGILERENAAILNAALLGFSSKVVNGFEAAIRVRGLRCPFYVSQNDGTLMNAQFVRAFPALTFASGPTNSLRGAAFLSGLKDAIVVDIGGTTSDIGVLREGFPRESNSVIEVGGVRTNFRMPDILTLGLGGGTLVAEGGNKVGPQSLGHRLSKDAMVFGGFSLSVTDVVVASGRARIGDPDKVRGLDPIWIEKVNSFISHTLAEGIDQMRPGAIDLPVILVGGGAIIAPPKLDNVSQIVRPEYSDVANAIGAAIAQVGAEAEQIVSYQDTSREAARNSLAAIAHRKAVDAGADANTIRVVDVNETPVAYMSGASSHLKVKVVGEIAASCNSVL